LGKVEEKKNRPSLDTTTKNHLLNSLFTGISFVPFRTLVSPLQQHHDDFRSLLRLSLARHDRRCVFFDWMGSGIGVGEAGKRLPISFDASRQRQVNVETVFFQLTFSDSNCFPRVALFIPSGLQMRLKQSKLRFLNEIGEKKSNEETKSGVVFSFCQITLAVAAKQRFSRSRAYAIIFFPKTQKTASSLSALAQTTDTDHSKHKHAAEAPGVDHSKHKHAAEAPGVDHSKHKHAAEAPGVDHSNHKH